MSPAITYLARKGQRLFTLSHTQAPIPRRGESIYWDSAEWIVDEVAYLFHAQNDWTVQVYVRKVT